MTDDKENMIESCVLLEIKIYLVGVFFYFSFQTFNMFHCRCIILYRFPFFFIKYLLFYLFRKNILVLLSPIFRLLLIYRPSLFLSTVLDIDRYSRSNNIRFGIPIFYLSTLIRHSGILLTPIYF